MGQTGEKQQKIAVHGCAPVAEAMHGKHGQAHGHAWWPCVMAQPCVEPSFVIKALFSQFLRRVARGLFWGVSLAILRLDTGLVQQIKPQEEDQFRIEDCNPGFNFWISGSFYQFKTKFSFPFSTYFIVVLVYVLLVKFLYLLCLVYMFSFHC